MYLALLNEQKKKLFLELVYKIACSDGDYSGKEKNMIASYCQEMQIEFQLSDISHTYSEIIDELNLICNETEKRIIAFESIGLAIVDGTFDDSEKNIVREMCIDFALQNKFIDECEILLNEYLKIQNKINELIMF